MPIFDFICKQCGHKFNRIVSNAEKNNVRSECGVEVKQMLSSFSTTGGSSGSDTCQSCAAGGGG